MQQRTTGLVVGLVSFVIVAVALLASTIYLYVEAQHADEKAKNYQDETQLARQKERKTEDAYGQLVGFVTGDTNARPEGGLDKIKEMVGADAKVANLKTTLEELRSNNETLKARADSLQKEVASAKSDAATARKEAGAAKIATQTAAKDVDNTLGVLRDSNKKLDTQVQETVANIGRIQDEIDVRRRNEVSGLQTKTDQLSSTVAEQSTRLTELQKVVDQVRTKPENAAKLVDGRVIDVGGTDGELFISLGSKNRLQAGMIFDVYDDAAAIQYDPATGNLVPGKARIQVLKVSDTTSAARVIPEPGAVRTNARRPVVKDDVIANPIYSPDYRYKFLVHGKFDVDHDGRATTQEAEFVRGRIAQWGGDVVAGDTLRGDLDFVVMGVQPVQPPQLAVDANEAAYTQYFEAKKAYEAYQQLFNDAQSARVPVLNWNRLQVLTNEGR